MKHYLILFVAILSISTGLRAGDEEILFHIDDSPVTVGEFEYIYNKNNFNNKADYSEKSLREYLDLYVNFRLKVKEAEALGLDKDVKLQSELKVYQQQLYNSFFDREHLKVLVDEAITRSEHDVHISHIFISVDKDADETIHGKKLEQINNIYAELESGKSFEELTAQYSEDKYTKDDGGRLAYYTALQIAFYPLESVAYTTEVGTYSKPVQTVLGYHIVKVNDKRPARGMAKASVIKIAKKRKADDGSTALSLIQSVYDGLSTGGDFSDYALKYSEDPVTKNKGGEMDWFGIAQYDPKFEDAVFNLQNIGDISSPFETSDAWYIVKLIDRKSAKASTADTDLITKKVQQSDRYSIMYNKHVDDILNKFGFEIVQPGYDQFKGVYVQDPAKLKGYLDSLASKHVIAKIAGIEFTDADFGKYIQENAFKYRRLEASTRYQILFNDFKSAKAVDFHVIEYGKENLEYGSLLNEYRDGILLFELMEANVWSRAVEDTSGLRTYFEKNSERFKEPEKAIVKKFNVENSKSAEFLANALNSDPGLDEVSWLSKLHKKGISTNSEDLQIPKTDALAGKLSWKKGANSLETDGQWAVYQVVEIIEEKPRTFEDSKGFAIAEYQEFLEKEWIANLRDKYKVVVDEETLMGLVKN